MSNKTLILILMVLFLVVASLVIAGCPVDRPLILPPDLERQAGI